MSKRKKIFVLIGFIAVIFSVLLVVKNKSFLDEKKYATLGGQRFALEIASTDQLRKKGLGDREGICENCGMLFEFPSKGQYNFWMKDMKFPLDIIWINDGKVVHLEKNVKSDFAGILKSQTEADMVLEINAGKSEEFKVKEGDRIEF